MLLHGKVAVIYGGGGAVGGALSRVFAREGASVFVAGRTSEALERVREDIQREGGAVFTAVVDALDEQAVTNHAEAVAAEAGKIDVVVNAIGVPHVQGARLHELTPEQFLHPILAYTRSTFLTTRAATPHMVRAGSGVVLTISTPGARLAVPGTLGNAAASAAIEAMTRTFAAELGPSGVRVVCLRPDVIPEALATSHVGRIFDSVAARTGTTVETMVADRARSATLLGRFPTLQQVADYAAFAASDRAGALTGAIANLSGGSLVD